MKLNEQLPTKGIRGTIRLAEMSNIELGNWLQTASKSDLVYVHAVIEKEARLRETLSQSFAIDKSHRRDITSKEVK